MIALAPASVLYAQTQDSYKYVDTLGKQKRVEFVVLPIAFYTPETDFGLGGGAQFFFKDLVDVPFRRESNILVTAIYTTKKQLIVEAYPKLYLADGKRYIDALFRYKVFPNSFWGIGNNTPDSAKESYNMRSVQVKVDLLERTFDETVRFGFEYYYDKHVMLELQEEGILEGGEVPGYDGAVVTGLGLIFSLDSRDNVYSSKTGWYFQFKGRFSSKLFGATHSYNKFEIDLRKYIVFNERHVLAGQLYTHSNLGDVPFQDMAWFGGGERGRGYFRGRYIDKLMYSAQVEYRFHISPRWIAAAFVSGGNVATTGTQYFGEFHPSAGGGVRFQIKKNNPTLVRLDIGIGRAGNSGVYFGVNEAF